MNTPAKIPINPNVTSGANLSYWTHSTEPMRFNKITDDLVTDVLIIGGGIAGLTTAYCLLQSGHKVIVVEDGYLGSGETGRTTAHLAVCF